MAKISMAIRKKLPSSYHSPAGRRYLKNKKKKNTVGKGRGKVNVSFNYYGGPNQRRKTADELLREIKGR